MEPITHFLTGACIGRAGLNRKTAYATLAAVLAAEAADMDILWSFAGPVEELKHHRGITHTFLGAPFVAGAVVAVIWIGHTPVDAPPSHDRSTPPKPKSAPGTAAGPLGLALSHGPDRRPQPSPARLDKQLRLAALLSIQSALVRGQLCLHRRASDLGVADPGFALCRGSSAWPTARLARAPSPFAAAVGPSLLLPEWLCSGAGAGQSMRRPRQCLRTFR